MSIEVPRAMETARRAVLAGGEAALRHFRTGFQVETKPDRTPVTIADRDSEAAILRVLADEWPGVDVLSEEAGAVGAVGGARWIIDPIDGTKAFVRGDRFWGPMVGLEVDGEVIAGAVALPAVGEVYHAGRGLGAHAGLERLSVSRIGALPDARVALGELHVLLGPEWRERVSGIAMTAQSARCPGDLTGCVALITGRMDAWLEAGVKIWDIAACQILVEEAGGRFTTLGGERRIDAGNVLCSNGFLHDELLAHLAG